MEGGLREALAAAPKRLVTSEAPSHAFVLLQVADFNLSRRIQEHAGQMTHSGSINSPQWSAPERLAGDDYSFPADVFSFGVILWELCTLSESLHEAQNNWPQDFSCTPATLQVSLISICVALRARMIVPSSSCLQSRHLTSGVRRAFAGVPWRDDDEPAAPLPPGRRPQRDSFFFVLRVVPAGERLPLPAAPDPAFPEYDQV